MKLSEDESEVTRVEMAPILDVVFLLLVFFIYSFLSMSVQKGIKVELPHADGSHERGEKIQVILDADNQFYLEKEPLSITELVNAVADRVSERDLPVLIRADRKAQFGPAVELLAKFKAHGIRNVAYQVQASEKE